ncbi:GumC family protein [Flavobacterium kingsejongi]|uniref:non-specific protein-tyrosine kinase n=1 Tax=Flavobacterium kingsejongi TaxID=1678728 RepID=A0A2S1LNN5_9FLAO|nr:tyrosine-protein kinase [Flavobacterium kingsejongi]AWG25377.1 tyrosine protein kinase [Flavobacterium kingsejongi]
MLNNLESSEENKESDFNIREQLEKYIYHWKWFLLATIFTIMLAFLYIRYATPQYRAVAAILIKDDKNGGLASEFASAIGEFGKMSGAKSNVENEIEVIKSRTLTEKTIKTLKLDVSYINQGRVKSGEIYLESPISLEFNSDSTQYRSEINYFTIEHVDFDTFILKVKDSELGIFKYGSVIKIKNGTVIVTRSNQKFKNKPFLIDVVIRPISVVTEDYRKRLGINLVGKNTSVIELSLIDPVKKKSEDFLNTLIKIYNDDAIEDKNLVSQKTSKFIAERLELITEELTDVEKNVEGFKNKNKLTDIPSEAELFLENGAEYEKNLIETEIQLNVVNSMADFLNKSKPDDLVPGNLIGSESEAASLIGDYNKLVIERNRIAAGATVNNPVVNNLDQKIIALKFNISQSLSRLKSSLVIKKRDLDRQGSVIGGKKAQVPRLEREFRIIDRQQKVKEALYLFLLQKREETAITLAATDQNAKVIDSGLTGELPVSPKKGVIFLVALILGILIPFLIIYILDLLDTKVKGRPDIEKNLTIPFLGDVPRSESHEEIISVNSRSSSAEALRILRTNVEFMLNHVPENKAKTIFLTSTLPGEGKTFIAVNLAGTFALSGKKVLLIGMDIRNPKLDEYMSLPNKGLTNYLSSNDIRLNDIIIKQNDYENFSVMPAGIIPPNPAELLMNKKLELMFEQLKDEYDYIIVDTAPVSLVTDTLLIAKNADAFVYVIRSNYLDKRLLKIPQTLYNQGKLPNMSVVLNDTDTKKGYGYGYGYGATEEKKPWYKNHRFSK